MSDLCGSRPIWPRGIGIDLARGIGIDLVREIGIDLARETGIDLVRVIGIDLVREIGIDLVREIGIDLVRGIGIDLVREIGIGSDPLLRLRRAAPKGGFPCDFADRDEPRREASESRRGVGWVEPAELFASQDNERQLNNLSCPCTFM